MKRTLSKRLLSFLISVALLFSAASAAFAVSETQTAENVPHGQMAQLNPEYIEYVENGVSGGKLPSTLDLSYLAKSYLKQSMRRNALLPAKYDLRDYGKVSRVEDQGIYGICWTFSALGSAETGLINQFSNILLSKFHLAWFTYTGDEEEEFFRGYYETDDLSPFDMGGTDASAVAALAAWKGPIYSEKLPLGTAEIDEELRYDADYHLQDAYYMPNGAYNYYDPMVTRAQIQTAKKLLIENGAESIIYYHDDAYYNEQNQAYYCDEFIYANHAVLLVGWDDNYSKENFNEDCRPENDGAWLIRNSWSTDWGDGGYFWLSYEDKTLDFGPFYKLEEKDNYTNNYQYDTAGWVTSVSADEFINPEKASKSGYMSNIFTAESNEQLEAVSFYTTDAGTEYEISVYTGVEKGKPVSGKLAFSGQSGIEPYAGYHTIELNKAVALKAGERFSVVVRLENPSYPYAIPVEACNLKWEMEAPEYMGDGGESFYSKDGKAWADITEFQGEMYFESRIYATNVCLKAFTNPASESGEVSNIHFSVFEGPLAQESELELDGAEEIYYKINGGATLRYTAPITLDVDSGDCTVTAWGVKNGKKGNEVSKTYTKAVSQLTELDYGKGGQFKSCDLSEDTKTYNITVFNSTDYIEIRPRGADTITVDGAPVKSNEWSEKIYLEQGKENTVEVVSSAEGKETAVYTLKIYRSALKYDYRAETVIYDDSKYMLTAIGGSEIPNGASITGYIGQELRLTDRSTSAEYTESVPSRQTAIASPIDFENEQTLYAYGNWNRIADNYEMIDSVQCEGDYIPVEPGQKIFIQKSATDTAFASLPVQLDIPDSRPEAPDAEVEAKEPTALYMKEVEGAQYRISYSDGEEDEWQSEWQYEPEFYYLEPDTEYTVEVRIAPTAVSFASEISTVTMSTVVGTMVTVSYQYNGEEYCSYDVGVVPGVNTVSADGELLDLLGCVLENPEEDSAEVTVTEQDGTLIADTETVIFNILPTVNFSDYSVKVVYWDADGNRLPFDSVQYFDNSGMLNINDILMLEGYQALLIDEYDETDEYDEFDDNNESNEYDDGDSLVAEVYYMGGAWRVFPPVVWLTVEKKACVEVVFKTEDGELLDELGYKLYYGEEGTQPVEAEIPEGYEAVGNVSFEVTVARDENGVLTADTDNLVVMLKSVQSNIPQNPDNLGGNGDPVSPPVNDKPSDTAPPAENFTDVKPVSGVVNTPQMGEDNTAVVWLAVFSVSAFSLCAVGLYSKNKKRAK